MEARSNYVADPSVAKKFREANKIVAELPEQLIQNQIGGKSQK